VLANAPDDITQGLFDYGDALGIAFQIADDLLDYWGGDKTGKNIGDDFRERKLTLPLIYAIEDADETERAFWQRVIAKGDQQGGDLETAIATLERHDALGRTRQDALDWAERAKTSLDALPESELKSLLCDIADYVVARFI